MKRLLNTSKRHMRDNYFVVGEGIYDYSKDGEPTCEGKPGDIPEIRKFRFSRIGPKGKRFDREAMLTLAKAMTASSGPDSANPSIPAGFTYLGQFVDHDLTMDKTAKALGSDVTLEELLQGRSPALDLDSLYGRGPTDATDQKFYADGIRLKTGTTVPSPPDAITGTPLDNFDLPRVGLGSTKKERRAALIPDHRNDENLVVAQTHLAFIRFHNRVVDDLAVRGTPTADLFNKSRELVVKHYQWMLKTDYLPRIVDPAIVTDVFSNGRKIFETDATPEHMPTMPIEFSVAAFRLGHSMIREQYEWNRVFHSKPGALARGTLLFLFQFSGTSGILSIDGDLNDPESGSNEHLPTNWIADFRRLYDFTEVGRNDLTPPEGGPNVARQIDTLLVDPLKTLPFGSFGGSSSTPPDELNLAFRNLMRAVMIELATGQQMADMMGVAPLSKDQLRNGNGGAALDAAASVLDESPLWFYILREAEFNGGKLGPVGGRIVAETFHRAMEGSQHSIIRDPSWRPVALVQNTDDRFTMADLLLYAFEGKAELLNPLGD
jgi:hypothetical protein